MSLRINHNTNALNAHRHLAENDLELSQSLEKLSSGMKINRAADGPASLVISERMRAQVAGLEQAVSNSEIAIALVQTAEGAFTEINRMLISMRQLAIHAANEGVNDEKMLQANQQEVEDMINAINRISTQTQFGKKRLLDGSNGANGAATGSGVEFVKAGVHTKGSTAKGYNVRIDQVATQAMTIGDTALTQDMVDAGESFMILEGGRSASYKATSNDSVKTAVYNLQSRVKAAGLNVTVSLDSDDRIMIQHHRFGSNESFQFSSSSDGVLSSEANVIETVSNGLDVKGTINNESAKGKGQLLTGTKGTAHVDGLTIRYTGDGTQSIGGSNDDDVFGSYATGTKVGNVFVAQNSLTFQVGANKGQTVSISLLDSSARTLGKGITNSSGFRSLSDINLLTASGAQDSLLLIDNAIDEITKSRADLGSFQKNTLESNLSNLRIATENMTAADSIIRDTDVASEMAIFIKNKVMNESSVAMLSHATQTPKSILKLLV